MKFRPLMKDLTEGTCKCYFCNHPLKSLKAYILENINTGERVFSGPTCAKNNIEDIYNLNSIPDLTKYTKSVEDKEFSTSSITKSKLGLNRNTIDEERLKKAVEYLILRENKLSKNFNCSYIVLKAYYNTYMEYKTLDNSAVEHIINIEKKAPDLFKLDNLQKCYNYWFWLNEAIDKVGSNDTDGFLISIKKDLEKNLNISEKQKKGVNKWLERLDEIPQLK